MLVAVDVEPGPEFLEIVENLLEAQLVEILHTGGVAERQLAHQRVRVGCQEGDVATATAKLDQIGIDDLTADDRITDRLNTHRRSPVSHPFR